MIRRLLLLSIGTLAALGFFFLARPSAQAYIGENWGSVVTGSVNPSPPQNADLTLNVSTSMTTGRTETSACNGSPVYTPDGPYGSPGVWSVNPSVSGMYGTFTWNQTQAGVAGVIGTVAGCTTYQARIYGGSFTVDTSGYPNSSSYSMTIRDNHGNDTNIGPFGVQHSVPDFTLACNPSNQTVQQGGSANYSVSASGTAGYSGTINVAVESVTDYYGGSVSGISSTGTSITIGSPGTITVSTTSTTPTDPNYYDVAIRGTDAVARPPHYCHVFIKVTAAGGGGSAPFTPHIAANGTEGTITIPYNTGATISWYVIVPNGVSSPTCDMYSFPSYSWSGDNPFVGYSTNASSPSSASTGNLTVNERYQFHCNNYVDGDAVVNAVVNVNPPAGGGGPYTLTFTKQGSGTGSVNSSPAGIACGTACGSASHNYTAGTIVSLSQAPAGGSSFAGWGGNCSGGSCSVTMDANKNVTGTFNAPGTVCGNGIVEGSEQCDDGNTSSGDGCSATCQTEGCVWPQTNPHSVCGGSVCVTQYWCGTSNCGSDANCASNPDFTLTCPSGNQNVAAGNRGIWTIGINAINGFNSGVSFTINNITPGGGLQNAYGTGTPPSGVVWGDAWGTDYQTYSFWVIGTSGSLVRTTTCSVTIDPNAPPPAFCGDAMVNQVGEQCDNGVNGGNGNLPNGSCPSTCSASCTTNVCSYNVVVTKNGTGTGTVLSTSSPSQTNVNCGASCTVGFTPGTVVTLTASPSGGSSFTGWSGSGCSGSGSCVVTMNATKNVTATFAVVGIVPSAPTGLVLNNSVCAQISVSWNASATGTPPIKYHVYRGPASSGPWTQLPVSAPEQITTTSFIDTAPSGTSYYAVDASNIYGGSAKTVSASAITPSSCPVSVGLSDKDLTAVNGIVNPAQAGKGSCSGDTDALTAVKSLKVGDVVTFKFNVCNSGDTDASTVKVDDTLSTYLNFVNVASANFGSCSLGSSVSNITATSARFNFGPVVPKKSGGVPGVCSVIYKAKVISPPGSASGHLFRVRNCGVISAVSGGNGAITPVAFCTPYYLAGINAAPQRSEISP